MYTSILFLTNPLLFHTPKPHVYGEYNEHLNESAYEILNNFSIQYQEHYW